MRDRETGGFAMAVVTAQSTANLRCNDIMLLSRHFTVEKFVSILTSEMMQTKRHKCVMLQSNVLYTLEYYYGTYCAMHMFVADDLTVGCITTDYAIA